MLGLHRRGGPDELEIGYWLDDAATGRGLMTDACTMATDVAFAVEDIDVVEIIHDRGEPPLRGGPRAARLRRVAAFTSPRKARCETGIKVRWRVRRDEWLAKRPSASSVRCVRPGSTPAASSSANTPDGARDAGAAEPAVAVRVRDQVLLVVVLGVVEGAGVLDLGGRRAETRVGQHLGERVAGSERELALAWRRREDGAAVLRAHVVALADSPGSGRATRRTATASPRSSWPWGRRRRGRSRRGRCGPSRPPRTSDSA